MAPPDLNRGLRLGNQTSVLDQHRAVAMDMGLSTEDWLADLQNGRFDSTMAAVSGDALAASGIEEPPEAPEPQAAMTAENQPKPGISETLDLLPESLKPRIEAAIDATDYVRSPEVERAMEGYYVDHNRLATVISGVADRSLTPEDAQRILGGEYDGDSVAMNSAVKGLVDMYGQPDKRRDTLKRADELVLHMVYNEASLGATTLQDEDLKIVPELHDKVVAAGIRDGVAFDNGKAGAEHSIYWNELPGDYEFQKRSNVIRQDMALRDAYSARQSATRLVRDDSRFAGQLLFHNTAHMDSLADGGYRLMSRTAQVAETGNFNSQTAIFEGMQHSNIPHFSEVFDPRLYKGEGERRSNGEPNHPGTIAVPLAEVIKTAPYARGNKYGVLDLKPDADTARIPINDKIGSINQGTYDRMGQYGPDRGFFADNRADHAREAHDYVLDAGKGMQTDQGNTAHQIFLTGELERERQAYGMNHTFESNGSAPQLDVFRDDPTKGTDDRLESKYDAELARQISELQAKSRDLPQFAGRVVVPLRQGVMEFTTETDRPPSHEEPWAYYPKDNAAEARSIPEEVRRAAEVKLGRRLSPEQMAAEKAEYEAREAAYEASRQADVAEMTRTGETPDAFAARKERESEERFKAFLAETEDLEF